MGAAVIRYSGGPIVNTTFSVGSTLDMKNAIVAALVAAGWTDVGGIGQYLLSVDPVIFGAWQPEAVTVEILGISGSNVLKIGIYVGTEATLIQMGEVCKWVNITRLHRWYYLLATSSRTYRIIADPFQFFIFEPGNFSSHMSFIAAGVPYVDEGNPPSPGEGITSWWLTGNGVTPTGTSPWESFRTAPHTHTDPYFYPHTSGVAVANGYLIIPPPNPCPLFPTPRRILANQNTAGVSSGQGGVLRLMWAEGNRNQGSRRWHNDESLKIAPTVAFGKGNPQDPGGYPSVGADFLGRISGVMWDSFLAMERRPADTTTVMAGHTWWNIMQGVSCSLWVAIN